MQNADPFTRVIMEHHSGLRHYIGGFGVNPAWVDDIAQDTFLVAHRKWEEFLKVENPGAWLRAVAKNLVLNETAKLNRRQRLLGNKLTLLLVEAEKDDELPEDPAVHAAKLSALRLCMEQLSTSTRSVIEARYFKDRNSSQIGEELAMKPAAVRKMLFLARQALGDCMNRKTLGNS